MNYFLKNHCLPAFGICSIFLFASCSSESDILDNYQNSQKAELSSTVVFAETSSEISENFSVAEASSSVSMQLSEIVSCGDYGLGVYKEDMKIRYYKSLNGTIKEYGFLGLSRNPDKLTGNCYQHSKEMQQEIVDSLSKWKNDWKAADIWFKTTASNVKQQCKKNPNLSHCPNYGSIICIDKEYIKAVINGETFQSSDDCLFKQMVIPINISSLLKKSRDLLFKESVDTLAPCS